MVGSSTFNLPTTTRRTIIMILLHIMHLGFGPTIPEVFYFHQGNVRLRPANIAPAVLVLGFKMHQLYTATLNSTSLERIIIE